MFYLGFQLQLWVFIELSIESKEIYRKSTSIESVRLSIESIESMISRSGVWGDGMKGGGRINDSIDSIDSLTLSIDFL